MIHRRHARGSALLVAVGLVVILSLLGITFVVIASIEAKQAEAIAAHSQAGPIVQGAIDRAAQMLYDDLRIQQTGAAANQWPYTSYGATGNQWLQFIDYPSEDADPHLASGWSPGIASWAHVSNLYGATAGVDNVATDSNTLEDTDLDGVKDALRVYTGATNDRADEFHLSVRMIDLSSFLCLNTAAEGSSISPRPPVDVNLKGYLGDALYDTVHDSRCRTASQVLADFNTNSAGRLASPVGAYLPFSAGDEAYLRWPNPSAAVEAGRTYELLNGLTPAQRRVLTTYSVTRKLLRNPVTAPGPGQFLTRSGVNAADGADRTKLYDVFKMYLEKIGVGNAAQREQMAAHFVANLWAYSTGPGQMAATNHWKFTPKAGLTVYGMTPQPVITEAMAMFKQSTYSGPDPSLHDHKWIGAVEIWNNTGRNLDLSQYKLAGAALSGTLNDGARRVYFDFDLNDGTNNVGDIQATFGVDPTGWTRHTDVKFYRDGGGSQTVKLEVTAGADTVPVDQVTSEDLGHVAVNFTSGDEKDDIRRDDDGNHARYTIAEYVATSEGTVQVRLGQTNNLSADELTAIEQRAKHPVPILYSGAAVRDLGELGAIYLTGPTPAKGFPQAMVDSGFDAAGLFEDCPARGRLSFHEGKPAIPGGGWGGGDYPGVPIGALLGEFFDLVPADATREAYNQTRHYGKVNINTATKPVLKQLPWPAEIGTGNTVDADKLADYIIAYRDKQSVTKVGGGTRDYASRTAASGVAGLRGDGFGGFLTPGELAVPCGDYATDLLVANSGMTEANLKKIRTYVPLRDSLYTAVSNMVSVRGDVFAVFIRVQTGDTGGGERNWHHLAVIDRSNCLTADDKPVVLLSSPVK